MTTDPESREEPPKRVRRRAVRPGPADSDPRPADHGFAENWDATPVTKQQTTSANEERLKRDKPPHWG